ncbi:MAG: hypothetical protein II289_00205 [Bacteroidales bacterium]|nr:hypothetical protein [Bacteroidales bacterium]
MSETKTFVFGDQGNASLNALLPFLQQKGIDPAVLYNMGNNGLFGNNGMEFLLLLIILAAANGNGNGFFGGGNNNSAEREMLMSAIQRNGVDISQLAQTIGCSTSRVQDAITQVSTQICQLAGQNAMSFQQIINSLQAGNAALATQLCQCCCDIKSEIANTNAVVTRGFSDVGYAFRDQTCNIEKAIAASTAQILEGQRNAEMRDLQDKLDAVREKNAQQAVMLNNAQQTAQFQAMLAPIAEDLASIKCKLPRTEVIPATPEYVAVNRSINVPYCGFGYGGFGFPGTFGNGCNNSLWG